MRAYEILSEEGVKALKITERATPQLGPGEILVRMKANTINYRDLLNIKDPLARGISFPRIPNSDGAGEVVEIATDVSRFKKGDHVVGTFFERWVDGEINADVMESARGGAAEGTLAEYVISTEDGLVNVPEHLSFAEAAALPCAGLTAWNALIEKGNLTPGDTVLCLGTGGVSIFALQFATMRGARVVITSSSDDKLALAKAAGAWETINYTTTPDWEIAVKNLTNGGVDHVVEVVGAGTLQRSLEAVRVGGNVSLIGVLTGGTINPTPIMRKSITIQGIYVGSKSMFERMNSALATNSMRPVIDKEFDFETAHDAYQRMESGDHFGKIAIKI